MLLLLILDSFTKSCHKVLINFLLHDQGIFERFDRDRSGKIDLSELREALLSLGFAVSPVVLELLVSKFDKSGGKAKAIEYDNFIEYVCFVIDLHLHYLTFCYTC